MNSSNQNGNTALYVASLDGHTAVTELLLNNGADVKMKSNAGITPLYAASQNGHEAVVALLRQHGATE